MHFHRWIWGVLSLTNLGAISPIVGTSKIGGTEFNSENVQQWKNPNQKFCINSQYQGGKVQPRLVNFNQVKKSDIVWLPQKKDWCSSNTTESEVSLAPCERKVSEIKMAESSPKKKEKKSKEKKALQKSNPEALNKWLKNKPWCVQLRSETTSET